MALLLGYTRYTQNIHRFIHRLFLNILLILLILYYGFSGFLNAIHLWSVILLVLALLLVFRRILILQCFAPVDNLSTSC